ncbi:H-NS histone family protein [Cereibacter sp. SYSU M97828]|nr:H-NS histone family protein [Cereibacter flavus]
MALPNLDALLKASHADLMRLRDDVITAIAQTEKENKRKAREELETRAKELGFSASELFGAGSAPKAGKAIKEKAPAKFRHPENPELTYSGRGRKPGWFADYVEQHGQEKAEKDLAI